MAKELLKNLGSDVDVTVSIESLNQLSEAEWEKIQSDIEEDQERDEELGQFGKYIQANAERIIEKAREEYNKNKK